MAFVVFQIMRAIEATKRKEATKAEAEAASYTQSQLAIAPGTSSPRWCRRGIRQGGPDTLAIATDETGIYKDEPKTS